MDKIKIILDSNVKDIPNLSLKKRGLSDNIFNEILADPQRRYFIKSKISQEVFESTIKYWVDDQIPDINMGNIQEYIDISEEIGLMKDIIEEKKSSLNESERVLYYLDDPTIEDKSLFEEEISKDLDNYLIKHGPVLMNQPIQRLTNIFSNNSIKFNQHNLAYKLIIEKYEKSGDSNIFVLLRFIDGKKLTHEYLRDAFEQSSQRNNFMPQFDFELINKIEDEIQKEKEIQKNEKASFENFNALLEDRLKSIESKIQEHDKIHDLQNTIDDLKNENKNLADKLLQMEKNSLKMEKELQQSVINQNQQNETIQKLEKFNALLEDRLKSIESKIQEHDKIHDLQNAIDKLKNKNKNLADKMEEKSLKIEEENDEMKNSIKYSVESSFCHYLYHCLKNSIQLDQINFPNYQNSYVYMPISRDGPGILSHLKNLGKDDFDREFIVSLSSRDPYNLFLTNWKGKFYSFNKSDSYIEINLKDQIELIGFEIKGSQKHIPKSYKIYIDDDPEPFLTVDEDTKMRDDHITIHKFDAKRCKKFKLVQTGPNWDINDKSYENVIGLNRIEFFTVDHPDGLFKYLNENSNQDPHLFPVKIDSNHCSTEDIHLPDSPKTISSSGLKNCYCEIFFLNGFISIEGYRLFRKKHTHKMKGWKIVGKTMTDKEIVISEFVDTDESSDPLHVSDEKEIKSKEYVKGLRIYVTEKNWDSGTFLEFYHFEIFGRA